MESILELMRIEQTEESTLGIFRCDNRFICAVLEEPWRDNLVGFSCIPEGRYPLELEYSPSHNRWLWTIRDVPGRAYIRIHTGNSVEDTEGCPLTVSYPGVHRGQRWGFESWKAFDAFMDIMDEVRPASIVVRSV